MIVGPPPKGWTQAEIGTCPSPALQPSPRSPDRPPTQTVLTALSLSLLGRNLLPRSPVPSSCVWASPCRLSLFLANRRRWVVRPSRPRRRCPLSTILRPRPPSPGRPPRPRNRTGQCRPCRRPTGRRSTRPSSSLRCRLSSSLRLAVLEGPSLRRCGPWTRRGLSSSQMARWVSRGSRACAARLGSCRSLLRPLCREGELEGRCGTLRLPRPDSRLAT